MGEITPIEVRMEIENCYFEREQTTDFVYKHKEECGFIGIKPVLTDQS